PKMKSPSCDGLFVFALIQRGEKPRNENAAVSAFLAAGERRREVAPREAPATRRRERRAPPSPPRYLTEVDTISAGLFFAL
ncbi:MAG: hypothetical protein VB068_11005, partial [Petrimonas sp.]|nr:hypothetical protein [Petrimonas sp.]